MVRYAYTGNEFVQYLGSHKLEPRKKDYLKDPTARTLEGSNILSQRALMKQRDSQMKAFADAEEHATRGAESVRGYQAPALSPGPRKPSSMFP
jgi:hypothetical protein